MGMFSSAPIVGWYCYSEELWAEAWTTKTDSIQILDTRIPRSRCRQGWLSQSCGEGQVPLWFASSLWGPNLCLHLHMTFSLCVYVSVPPFTVDTVYIALGLYPTAVRSHPTYYVSNSPFFQTRPHCAVVGCQDHTGIWTEHISTSNSIFHISVTKNFRVALAGLLMNNGYFRTNAYDILPCL